MPEPDRTIGRYRVLKKIGVGGMSEVYRAYDPSLDRQVALKLMPPYERDDGFRRLEREARAMAQLAHPNVATVFEVGRAHERCFLAMELVQGLTARQWLDETPRPWTEILWVFLQAGRGLAAAHRAGLVHRDFKPSNVLVGDDGRVRVADFGLARPTALDPHEDLILPADTHVDMQLQDVLDESRASDLTHDGLLVGTPAYMAPEQLAGESASAASDQFAYCVSLWQALYRQRPYPGRSAYALAHAMERGALVAPPARCRVPGWVRNVLTRGLDPEPSRRYDAMGSLMAALVFTWRVLHA